MPITIRRGSRISIPHLNALWLALVLVQGCASEDMEGGATGGGDGTDNDFHQACVDRINELRATVRLSPLERWTDAESCSDAQAKDDHVSGMGHGSFGRCGENGQNTCPDWPSQASILGDCLDQMWAEGPAPSSCGDACLGQHGHYLNMTSTTSTRVACGLYDDGAGAVWSNQNFK